MKAVVSQISSLSGSSVSLGITCDGHERYSVDGGDWKPLCGGKAAFRIVKNIPAWINRMRKLGYAVA